MTVLGALIAAGGMAALDVCWALYTIGMGDRRRLASSGWAVALHLLSAVVTLSYVDDKRYLIFTSIGAFIGTYLGVVIADRWSKK